MPSDLAPIQPAASPQAAAALFLDRGMSLPEFASAQGVDISTAAAMLSDPDTIASLRRLRDTGHDAIRPMGPREAHEVVSVIARTSEKEEGRLAAAKIILDMFKGGKRRKRYGTRALAAKAIAAEIIDVGGEQ